ncbi:MAG: DUF72 domain-containing protein [Nanoarchaeota archaeon]|nr:DUF72 domain-containing protein [Nanoarchaeota archaeon]
MKVFVGTSGWMYSWNSGHNLDWYASETKLNAVELNASFYRFPFPSQIKHWSKAGKDLSWSIKVNRSITHLYKLSKNSYQTFQRFQDLFSPLEQSIDNYLFQLPPGFLSSNKEKVLNLVEKFNLFDKAVIEPRDISWFDEETQRFFRDNKLSMVSIDAPIGQFIVKTTNKIYLRMHGRTNWYSYDYSSDELSSLKRRIIKLKPEYVYIFFNNNHDMLNNAVKMRSLF